MANRDKSHHRFTSGGHDERPEDIVIEIDLEEFEEARRDPKVIETLERAKRYAEGLVNRGHCTQCLVINCEHICWLPKEHWSNVSKLI